jgi:type IV secretion system protein VirB5
MKHYLINSLVCSFLSLYPCFAGTVPVIDVSSLAQQVMQVQHMVHQIEQLQEQIGLAKDELKQISGSRGLRNLINSAYDKSILVNPEDLLRSEGIKNAVQIGLKGELAHIYNKNNSNSATWLAQSQKSLQQSKQRFSALMGLLDKVNNSPEQKDILDLQARIGVEQTFLQNEIIKLSMLQSETQAKKAIQEQKIQQMRLESGGNLSNFSLTPSLPH